MASSREPDVEIDQRWQLNSHHATTTTNRERAWRQKAGFREARRLKPRLVAY
jgi:hypothetical protein